MMIIKEVRELHFMKNKLEVTTQQQRTNFVTVSVYHLALELITTRRFFKRKRAII